ncbi:MAG: UDP-N-acetylmuramate dehydrogenase [Candidatus Omnitrophica bacterium]|nr:UDP-N-acetylmuramate dehydrogenase [Candidatus Omnitrophota bacterium]
MNWLNTLRSKVRRDILLSKHTTFKIGGKADFFVEPINLEDLRKLLMIAKDKKLRIFIIGQGSNILVHDEGVRGIVVKFNSEYFRKIRLLYNCLKVGAGVKLNEVLQFCLKKGLSGLEFLIGIPATVGGALVMNAGGRWGCIGERVKEVKVMDYNGNIKKIKSQDLRFSYRYSNLRRFIILEVLLKLVKADKEEILKKINYFLRYRKLTQDLSYPSAGCIFKNPKGLSAGELIELCGLKGKTIGDARVSLRHANFIINQGNASAKDVLSLIDYIRDKVKKKFNLDLELEIEIW